MIAKPYSALDLGVGPEDNQRMSARFWSKVIKTGACWNWNGEKDRGGYGVFYAKTIKVKAHRFAYEETHGRIAEGLTIDHLCRNRSCVNPAHMEPVTKRENTLRGVGVSAQAAQRITCPRGHPLVPGNLTSYDRKLGFRRCLICARDSLRQFRAKQKSQRENLSEAQAGTGSPSTPSSAPEAVK